MTMFPAMLGLSEILFLGLLALLLIGPKELPEVARNIARFINQMKRASSGLLDELKSSQKDLVNQALELPPVKKENSEEKNV